MGPRKLDPLWPNAGAGRSAAMRLAAHRKYKTGTRWCFWRWTDVDSEYITRLHVLKTPWFAVCLHWIHKPDPEPHLHDHPVSFLSLILRGWYWEFRGGEANGSRGPFPCFHRHWFNRVRATDRHSICEVAPDGALTLALMGPKVREWGFHTPAGWVYWRDYYAQKRSPPTPDTKGGGVTE